MTKPLDNFRSCPQHQTYMVPHVFGPHVIVPRGVEVFRCPNLGCSIFYVNGALEGFYTLKSNGELTPYPNPSDKL